ncbi:MAG TPA: response regulator [Bacilli bacterium]
MIKVIIADDHYPVLEFLYKAIPWEQLGLEVIAQCSDGREVLEHCGNEVPDILITDIGMPRMNGLELIKSIKAINPDIQVVILSCHDEFQYAQNALKEGVKEYILKESLQPEELTKVLRQLSESIRANAVVKQKNDHLTHVLDQNTASIKNEFIRNLISNPIINEHKWLSELQQFGIHDVTQPIMPVLIYPNRYLEQKERFKGEELFSYAFDNVVNEIIDKPGVGVSFRHSSKQTFLLFSFVKSLKINPYEIIRGHLVVLLRSFERIGITVSAVTYEPAANPFEMKKSMMTLAFANDQRFYASIGSIYKWIPFKTSEADLFAYYEKAIDELRQLIPLESLDYGIVIKEWMQFLRDERFQADSVRSWILKLMMDIELKYNSLQHFHDRHAIGPLHHYIAQMDTIHEIEQFILTFIRDKILLAGEIKQNSQRLEIHEAKKYVTARLHEKIGMEEVAQILNLNPSYFSRFFKSETGETFTEYVTRVKMEKAKEKLNQSGSTVEQIAESLGYDNTSYFIKLFKAYSGYSPKEYRFMK